MGAPVLIGAGIGAATSLATGGNPLQGALLGGIGGGTFGGSGALGSGFTEGGLFSLGSGLSGAGTVATSTPTLGGLALEGATTGAVGGALAGGGAAGATASPYAFGNNALEVTGNTMNPALIGSSAGGQIPFTGVDRAIDAITPSGGYDPSGGNFISNMVKKDPMGSAMLANASAQNLLNPQTSGITPPQLGEIRRGATEPDVGAPLNVLSPADYGTDMVTDEIGVTGDVYSVFPERLRGFGSRGMFYR
jgi:hypothetical protein